MPPRSRHAPLPAAHTTYHPYGNSVPRHPAIPQSDVCFSTATLDQEMMDSHFSLTSSPIGSRHHNPLWNQNLGPGPDVDDYLSGYETLGLPGSSFPITMMPTRTENMDGPYGLTAGPTLMRDLPIGPPSHIPGLDATDMMIDDYAFMDLSPGDSILESAYYTDLSSHSSLTPPPEEYLQRCFEGSTVRHDKFANIKEDAAICENLGVSKLQAYSASRHYTAQPRPIRPSSERTDSRSTGYDYEDSPDSPKEDSPDKVKARNDPLYNAKPDKDGLYRCPFVKRADKCSHKPTKQKCIYSKYLDSHLRPYKCKFAAPNSDCEDARFSSNACLFRHERETHGMHNHGHNPYLCLFEDCERAKQGNGFPRRWNQRDHMKRMHNWEGDVNSPDRHGEVPRRRKAAPGSVPMRRSEPSSYARAQQANVAYSKDMRRTSRHGPQVAYATPLQACNVVAYPSTDNIQFTQSQFLSGSRHLQKYPASYPYATAY